MLFAMTDDGVKLHYLSAGSGTPLVFVHEFAGAARSWEPQLRFFSRRHRCIAFDARGYPPSDVPGAASAYSQDRARDDIVAVLDHLNIEKAHIVGLSMGAFATLHFGFTYPHRAHSLVVAGCGYGAEKAAREQFRAETEATAWFIEAATGAAFADRYGAGPARVQFQNKDPRGWAEFRDMLAEHSLTGAALTLRGVQKERPSLFDLEEPMRNLSVPTLIMTGDEDEPCLMPAIFMKRTIRSAALQVLPNSGHTINLEEPALFNAALAEFITQVEAGRWQSRDPRSLGGSILGMADEHSQ
ncbi:MAG: alpha/beta fold hydrolase [Gammaproteobacteria bacterium]|nr:alpha/beta fold hydrolase [Gammaproteobacteria bacterium]